MSKSKVGSSKKRFSSTAILDQDTDNISTASAEDWWHEIEKLPDLKRIPSFPIPFCDTTPSLNDTKQLSSPRIKHPSISYPTNELNNSSDVRGHLSAEIVKNNVLETTSESEKEMSIKKKKALLTLPDRKSTENHFLSMWKLHTSGDETADTSRTSKNLSSSKISSKKLQKKKKLQKEDSEDSMSNIVPLKLRRKLLRKMPEEGNNATLEKLIDIMNRSEHSAETLNKSELGKFGGRYTDSSNLLSKSSEAQHSNVEHVMSDSVTSEDNRDLFRKRRPALQSRVMQRMQEKKNSFEAVFADNSDASLPRSRDMIQEVDTQSMTRDTEHRMPRISSLHSETPVDSSKNDFADNQLSTSPRSKFFKALKRSSKETQDKIKQDMLGNSSSDVYNVHDERSAILKPKTRMMKRALDISSIENPFEDVLQEHSGSSTENNTSMSIRNRVSPELDVAMETSGHTKFTHPMINSPVDKKEKLRKSHSKSVTSRERSSSSVDDKQDESISNEQHGHSEKQHTEVSDTVDVLGSVSRENRTVTLSKKSSSKFMLMEEASSDISDDNVSTSEISVDVRMNTDELGSSETVIDDPPDETTKKSDRSTPVKRASKNVHEKVRLTRSKSATPKSESDVSVNLPRRSIRLANNSAEHSNDLSLEPEIKTPNTRWMRSSTSNSRNTSVGERASKAIDKSTELEEAVAADEIKDATPASQRSSQNSLSPGDRTDNKITRRTSAKLSAAHNESNVKKTQNTSLKQLSLTKPQGQRSPSVKASSKGNISKTHAPNRVIEDFFKVRHFSPDKKQATSSNPMAVPSKTFKDAKKMQQIKERVETMKSRELAEMKMRADKIDKRELALNVKASGVVRTTKKKLSATTVKKVDPAYLVNGKVYKAPRLLRPKQWVTDRLYKFLWKCLEPKYKLSMRVRSEKFIGDLSKIVTLILRRKKYNSYKAELEALMKEMARLQIINTRNDFYNFCRDFMPYEFRVKVIPILLPGNQKTIPYDPDKLHTPLLDE